MNDGVRTVGDSVDIEDIGWRPESWGLVPRGSTKATSALKPSSGIDCSIIETSSKLGHLSWILIKYKCNFFFSASLYRCQKQANADMQGLQSCDRVETSIAYGPPLSIWRVCLNFIISSFAPFWKRLTSITIVKSPQNGCPSKTSYNVRCRSRIYHGRVP